MCQGAVIALGRSLGDPTSRSCSENTTIGVVDRPQTSLADGVVASPAENPPDAETGRSRRPHSKGTDETGKHREAGVYIFTLDVTQVSCR